MMVTSICREEITYDNDDWGVKPPDPVKQLTIYNDSRKRFLFYPWGVWCTAYARRNLWYGIVNFGQDYIYSDTDSIKCINLASHKEFVDRYNQLCEDKLRAMCEHYGLNYEEELLPKTIKGETKPLGVYDHDGHYQKFKTLGAKRYMTYEDGKLSITVSGVNKKTAVPWLLDKLGVDGAFEAFEEGLILPEDATGKLTHYYIDKEYSGTVRDYNGKPYDYHAMSGIYLEKATYCFDISIEYINFLKGIWYTK